MRGLLNAIAADIGFYSRLESPGAQPGIRSGLTLLLGHKGLWLLLFQRCGYHSLFGCRRFGMTWWMLRPIRATGRYWSAVFCKSEIDERCQIEGPIYVTRKGYLMCSAQRIGARTVIHDHCTFGFRPEIDNSNVPVLGPDVWIGPNCVIVGPVHIGAGATILPGSVVTRDVRPRAVMRGNPAVLVREDFDNSSLRSTPLVVSELRV